MTTNATANLTGHFYKDKAVHKYMCRKLLLATNYPSNKTNCLPLNLEVCNLYQHKSEIKSIAQDCMERHSYNRRK